MNGGRTTSALVAALAWLLVLAGCGEGDEGPTADGITGAGDAPVAAADGSGPGADAPAQPETGGIAASDTASGPDVSRDVAASCALDGWCVPGCDDPDCGGGCACDSASICEAAAPGETTPCPCDPDCVNGAPCGDDAACDTWCPDGVDPDCEPDECPCAVREGVCEVAGPDDTSACPCDPDCDGADPCMDDGVCDGWCPAGEDPDCAATCVSDGVCDESCAAGADPDCAPACDCDDHGGVCDPRQSGSTLPCACDVDCDGLAFACRADDWCDERCPDGNDVDCGPCGCEYNEGICEPARNPTTDPCACDPACLAGGETCVGDGHCDTWCPEGADPDC